VDAGPAFWFHPVMSTDPNVPSRRPIVRSSRLVHHRSIAVDAGHQVMTPQSPQKLVPPPEKKTGDEAPTLRARKKHRFVRSVAVATLMTAGLAHADDSGRRGGFGGLGAQGAQGGNDTVVELVSPDVAVAPTPEDFASSPTLLIQDGGDVGMALGYKLDGLKDNPYLSMKTTKANKGGLIKKVPRARKVAWKKVGEDVGYQKVSDLKGNPYE
jgi:hypothetical protein